VRGAGRSPDTANDEAVASLLIFKRTTVTDLAAGAVSADPTPRHAIGLGTTWSATRTVHGVNIRCR